MMPPMTVRTEYRSDTGLTTGCSTWGTWTLLQRRRLSSETSCFLMTSCALRANTEQIMQHEMNCLLRLRGRTYRQLTTWPTIQGSKLLRVLHIDTEVNNKIAKASVAFGSLHENVWERIAISLTTKLKVYRAAVLITLLPLHARPGLCTADAYTPSSSIISTCAASVDFSTSDDRTNILTRCS